MFLCRMTVSIGKFSSIAMVGIPLATLTCYCFAHFANLATFWTASVTSQASRCSRSTNLNTLIHSEALLRHSERHCCLGHKCSHSLCPMLADCGIADFIHKWFSELPHIGVAMSCLACPCSTFLHICGQPKSILGMYPDDARPA